MNNHFLISYDAAGVALEAIEPAVIAGLGPDVLFLAHGWLNDRQTAAQLFESYAALLAPMPVIGVLWPSLPKLLGSNAQGVVKATWQASSYYAMKERAGMVGAAGLAPLLCRLYFDYPGLRIHLAGHSFGARLVTAAAAAQPGPSIQSMTLIQAAFSQYAFSYKVPGYAKSGAFRTILDHSLVRGPILVTHSCRDIAVGAAYPIASLLRRQNASRIGGATDPYGGLGRNGAQALERGECASVRIGDPLPLRFPVININCDSLIRSHTDIHHPEIAAAIRAAAAGPYPPRPAVPALQRPSPVADEFLGKSSP
ncbi:MAG: hypothetical protein HZB13_18925 [Acidobacteria bacterium]|nr:hypothetical protein [Acidobacteriota bacterium]